MPQPARWNGASGHSPSPARLGAVIRFGFLNIGRINRRSDVTSNCVLKPPVLLVLVDAVDFLNANDQNEVRLPVVKYLPSQRASSIQALAIYLMVVRLVLINRTSFNNADRWATPKNQMRSCETDFGQGFTNRH
jgi:hypothetical protein